MFPGVVVIVIIVVVVVVVVGIVDFRGKSCWKLTRRHVKNTFEQSRSTWA